MSNVNIPQDLVFEVLSRSSVKSSTRFKCVSKSWCQMVESPVLIKTHSERSKSNMKVIAKVITSRGRNKLYYVDKETLMKEIKFPFIWEVMIAGSSNGLVCLVYVKHERQGFVLMNPSTQTHIVLPICLDEYGSFYGFGYDESTDDYKVVSLVRHSYDPTFIFKIYIYSLKSNKWRRLEDFASEVDIDRYWFEGFLFRSTLHWELLDKSTLTFNLITEKFQVLPPPQTSIKLESPLLSVASDLDYLDKDLEWIMKDTGSKKTADLLNARQYFFDSNNIKIYNCEKQLFEEVEFPIEVFCCTAYPYFESLVPLRLDSNAEKVEEDIKKMKQMDYSI